jgi:Right handed beta helix region/Dockerin type I domain
VRHATIQTIGLLLMALAPGLRAATYEVGPGKPFASIGAVSWESLQPGDSVLIHWRSTAYKEKWVIGRQGTATAPIIVRGVAGPAGQLPVIDGNGATTRTSLNYWNEVRGLLKIGGSNVPPDTTPQYLVIENLEFRSARPPYTFTAANGTTQSYVNNAASIYVEKGQHVTIRNCVLDDSGNGLFIGSPADQPSRDFLIEGSYIYGNGNAGSAFEHNNYSAAIGIVFQYNRFGPLRAGTSGNNLKDRSAGLVVRYNWIEGGNRQLDLVDAEDSGVIVADPSYRTTLVYGNILIEPANDGNRQMVHYGGDSGTVSDYRKGTLHMYNNTLVSTRTDRTTLLRLSTNEETADFRNNIVYPTLAGNTVALLDQTGALWLTHNWFKPGWVSTFGTLDGTIHDDGSAVTGTSPGFVDVAGQDFRIASSSSAINAGTSLAAAVVPLHALARQYVKHQSSEVRASDAALDIGAYEYSSAAVSQCDLNMDANVNIVDIQGLINLVLGLTAAPPGVGDLNRDGFVNIVDVQALANIVIGVSVCPL